jgi:MOSC domain-containing protein YiiM
MIARVVAVHRSDAHTFSKVTVDSIELVPGYGVVGDAHYGANVMHRSRVAADPTQPNLRQVHLVREELFAESAAQGFIVKAGDLGENVTTRGLDLIALPTGTALRIGDEALVILTGLRNPCGQINGFQEGLLGAMLDRDADGNLIRKTGVLSVVVQGGIIKPGDAIRVSYPPEPHRPMDRI